MRTRTKDLSILAESNGPFTVVTYSPSSVQQSVGTIAGGPDVTRITGTETIIDGVGINREIRYVKHTKELFNYYRFDSLDETSGSSRYVWSGPNAAYRSWGLYGQIGLNNLSVSYLKSTQQLIREAILELRHGVEADNLLNAVELHQLASSVSTITNRLQSIRGSRPRRALWRLSGVASSMWLGWAFGLGPLIKDMKTTSAALARFGAKYRKFVNSSNRVIAVHKASVGSLSISTMPAGGGSAGDGASWWHPHINMVKIPQRVVTIYGKRLRNPYETEFFAKLDFFMRRYVSEGPASFLWEKIPFSFVIDWFADTSAVLTSLDDILSSDKAHVQSACVSESFRTLVSVIHHANNYWSSSLDNQAVAHSEVNYYERKPIDARLMFGASGRFGKRQFAHSAALLREFSTNLSHR